MTIIRTPYEWFCTVILFFVVGWFLYDLGFIISLLLQKGLGL